MARDIALARVNRANGLHHLPQRRVFQQIALRSGLDGAIDIFIGLIVGKNDHASRTICSLQRLQHLNPAHAGHAKVQQDDLRVTLLEHPECLFATRRGADQLQLRLRSKHAGKSGPHDGMIIHDKNSDRACRALLHNVSASIEIVMKLSAAPKLF